MNKPVRRIAIVGTGVIGASWAAEFLAHGFDVVATDDANKFAGSVSDMKRWPLLPRGAEAHLTET